MSLFGILAGQYPGEPRRQPQDELGHDGRTGPQARPQGVPRVAPREFVDEAPHTAQNFRLGAQPTARGIQVHKRIIEVLLQLAE